MKLVILIQILTVMPIANLVKMDILLSMENVLFAETALNKQMRSAIRNLIRNALLIANLV